MIIPYLNKPQIDPEWFLQAFVSFYFHVSDTLHLQRAYIKQQPILSHSPTSSPIYHHDDRSQGGHTCQHQTDSKRKILTLKI